MQKTPSKKSGKDGIGRAAKSRRTIPYLRPWIRASGSLKKKKERVDNIRKNNSRTG